ncbi:MAG: transglycosylase domain-containing protein [Erysipelotrichaceae bacterium]
MKNLNEKKNNNQNGTTNKPKNKRKRLNNVVIGFLSLVLIGGVCAFFLLGSIINEAGHISDKEFNSTDSNPLYDNENVVFTSIGKEQRESINYEKVPQSVIDAFLSIEDSRFFIHNGFDLPRFLKSAVSNVSSGSLSQGGSTLTMQMVDNIRVDQLAQTNNPLEKIKRKVQEIWLSMDSESRFTKKEIFEKYLNKINFGAARGIQKAASFYFNKDVTQLTLSESAFLAGVINAPGRYNPYISHDNYVRGEQRRNVTLDLMYKHGYITEEECKLEKSTKLAFALSGLKLSATDSYQAFIDAVAQEAKDEYGVNIYSDEVAVYTTLDNGAQQLSDEMVNGDGITFPSDPMFQTGFTFMDNQNGEIWAIGGGRGYTGDDNMRINRAYDYKQTGSSIKPILDYAPAFDKLGWATSHTLRDVPIAYPGMNNFVIRNANGSYMGDVQLKEAVARSLNTTAISALSELVALDNGINNSVSMLNKLGFRDISKQPPGDIEANNFSLGYGIGGSDMVATPTQMAGAFSIFANNGQYIKPHTIRKIVFKDKKREPIVADYNPVNIISEDAAYMMSTLLKDAVDGNWYNLLQILQNPFPVYAKSGTSDWGEAGEKYGIPKFAMRDKWIVAYTSTCTVATWAGYDYDATKYNANTYVTTNQMLVNVPGQIGKKLLAYGNKKHPASALKQPAGVTNITHVKGKFPYATPPEGTPSDMIASGLIRSKFAKLETLTPDPIDKLAAFSATFKDETSDNMVLTFTPYPNAEKLKPASHTQSIKGSGGTITGNVYYDPAFLYGEIVYKARVSVDGKEIGDYTLSSDKSEQVIPIDYGKTAEICGYYAYKNTNTNKSNEVCTSVTRGTKPEAEEKPTPDPMTPPDKKD